MKERFTAEEWDILLGMPAQLIVGTAMVDHEGMDSKEMVEAAARLAKAATEDPDPLYRELARDFASSKRDATTDMSRAQPERCKQILQDKLTEEEYQRFLISVWVDGIAVARSSGGKKRTFRKDIDPVSENEAKLLAGWAMFYGIDPRKMAGSL